MYQNGLGVRQDYEEAVRWYRESADNGNASGQYNLGYMYRHGYGVEQDYDEAVSWWIKAARQGNNNAQTELRDLGVSW